LEIEKKLVEFVMETKYEDLPQQPIDIVKTIILTNLGSIIAGAGEESCRNLVNLVKDWGGKPEATILIYGGKIPGYNAALANGTIARSLDYEDAIVPGLHMGPVAFPAALAAAEIAGGCGGKEFLTSLLLGIEMADRINLVNLKAFYGGFKGTGVCSIFAATAAAGRILHLNSEQMFNAFGLALNRAGGSGQSNIDGAQAVHLVAGFASQSGIVCAQMAQRGITGPRNFIEGPFGWLNMFGRDKLDRQAVTGDLGTRFELTKTLFKKFPSCGLTQTCTQGILELIAETGIAPEDVQRIDIRVGPFAYTATGHFEIGNSPRVNAQFSIPYCVANALLRKSSRLQHFEEESIRDPRILDIVKKIRVIPDPEVEKRSQRGMEMEIKTGQGRVYQKVIDIPRGSPGNEMTREEHTARYLDCASYGRKPLPPTNVEKIIPWVDNLSDAQDVLELIPLMLSSD
jgi:2-methylcitrate dehydratase PrpD